MPLPPAKDWMTDPLFQRTADGDVYYYHNDHLGTPQQMVDASGSVVWEAQYSVFGKAHITVSIVENNLRFPGQYFDVETGLHQNYFRDYDSELGRYIQSDPIGLVGGINSYAYVEGNPIIYFDFMGLSNCYVTNKDEYGNIARICKGADTVQLPNRCPSGDCAVYPLQTNTPGNNWHGQGPFGLVCGPSSNPIAASWIPDDIWKDACQKHDDCYATCGKTKSQCDEDFLISSGNSFYFYAVVGFADSAYEKAQKDGGCNNECQK